MVRLAGVGPGSIDQLTLKTYKALKTAKNVLAFGRVGSSLEKVRSDIIKIYRVSDLLEYIDEKEDLLILASGDPLFYGISNYLKRNQVVIDEILPGLSSFQYFMAQLQKPWQESFLFSVHGREFDIDLLLDHSLSIGLVDRQHSPNWLSTSLYEKGARGRMWIGSQLSYEEEKIIEGEIGQVFNEDLSLSVVVIEIDLD